MTGGSSSPYGAAAREALGFIDSLHAADPPLWAVDDGPQARPQHSLYHGAAGVILVLLELHATDGDDGLLERAVAAGDTVATAVTARGELPVDCSRGWSGYAFVFNELAKASGEQRFADAARHCFDAIDRQSQPIGSGIGWIEPMPFSELSGFTGDRELWDLSVGAAGVLLALLYAADEGVVPGAVERAEAVARRLVEVGIHTDDGTRWQMMPDIPWPFSTPNFAHGGAGVGYALLQLHRRNGDPDLLDAAREAARYTMSRSTPIGDHGGRLVCHVEEASPWIYYLGACHGPAGTGRLLLELAEVTGHAAYLDDVAALADGIDAIGAPEQRSPGLWNNHSQCCGDAGIGEFALLAARRTGEQRYLDLARCCADVILAASESDGRTRRWRFAEHRSQPGFVQAQTGYMQGAAGIASFLNHLQTTLDGEPVKIRLPDWPA